MGSSEQAEDVQLTDELAPFYHDDFDIKEFSSSIIRGQMITEYMEKLQGGIGRIQQELYDQVACRHADLLTQATGIQRLEDVLSMINSRVEGLQKSIMRTKEKLSVPYESIKQKTGRLQRMQSACELLRRTVRFLTLTAKLREQRKGGARDMSRAAYTLSEIQHLVNDRDLHGIHVIERERSWIYEVREDIEKQAREILNKGLDQLKHQTLTTALQVFHNLGSLKDEVDSILSSRMQLLQRSLEAVFSLPIELHGKYNNDSGIRAYVWENFDTFLKQFRKISFESRTLELVMSKRRSQTSYETFAQIVEPASTGVAHRVWLQVLSAIESVLEKTPAESPTRKVLNAGYPKMIQLFMEKWGQILDHFSTDYNTSLLQSEQTALRKLLQPFEHAYITASLSRMFDPVNRMFPDVGAVPPTPDDISDMVKTVIGEVMAALSEQQLLISVSRNVLKTAEWFCIKSEHLQATDVTAIDVTMKASVSMKRNIALINQAWQLHLELQQSIRDIETTQRSALPPKISSTLLQASTVSCRLSQSIADPLLASIKRYIFETVASLEDDELEAVENIDQESDEMHMPCSQYMHKLKIAVEHIYSQVLRRFSHKSFIVPWTQGFLQDVVNLYVITVCTLDNMPHNLKLKLTADVAQFEIALDPLLSLADKSIKELGDAYRALRAIRPLLFLDTEQISTTSIIDHHIPRSLVVHYLFSQTDQEIPSPRICDGSEHVEYALWLLNAKESERLNACDLALARYRHKNKNREQSECHHLYPIMLAMVSIGVQASK
eukprot:gene2930-5735_t